MGKNFYAVRVGAIPGIYTDWEEAKKQIINSTKDLKQKKKQ